MGAFKEYADYDALGLAGLVRDRQVTPLELIEEAVERVEAVNPKLNAVVLKMYDEARTVAQSELPDGTFRGVPFLIKDLLACYRGFPTTGGSRFYEKLVREHDTELVRRQKRAGLVIFGKTNTPELGIVGVTEPELHGPTHTPWQIGRTSGGSSGGAGAMTAAGVVPMAHGGDGGGSIRIPASCCGVFGFKPTRARTPTGPDASEYWHGFAIEHALTRSVRDSAALLDATCGPEIGMLYAAPPQERPFLEECSADPGKLRVAYTTKPHLPAKLHPDCAAAVDDAAKLLDELGHHVEEVDLDIDSHQFASDFVRMVSVSTATEIEMAAETVGRKPTKEDFELTTWLLGMLGRETSALDHDMSLQRLRRAARRLAPFFETYDVLLSPTLGSPPVRVGELQPRGAEAMLQSAVVSANLWPVLRLPGLVDKLSTKMFDFTPFTMVWNVSGQPSMSVPLYWNDAELPIGTMLTGRFGDDATLFRLAAQLEKARPWKDRRPPVNAFEVTS